MLTSRSLLDQWQHKRRRRPATGHTQYANRPTTEIKGGVPIIPPPCGIVDYAKFEKDRTKTVVAVVDDRYCGQTDTQVILYLSNVMHCTGQLN